MVDFLGFGASCDWDFVGSAGVVNGCVIISFSSVVLTTVGSVGLRPHLVSSAFVHGSRPGGYDVVLVGLETVGDIEETPVLGLGSAFEVPLGLVTTELSTIGLTVLEVVSLTTVVVGLGVGAFGSGVGVTFGLGAGELGLDGGVAFGSGVDVAIGSDGGVLTLGGGVAFGSGVGFGSGVVSGAG